MLLRSLPASPRQLELLLGPPDCAVCGQPVGAQPCPPLVPSRKLLELKCRPLGCKADAADLCAQLVPLGVPQREMRDGGVACLLPLVGCCGWWAGSVE
jgi:hypothetical protein